MVELDITRHSLGVDPTLHVWGWEVPVYLFLGGLAAGVMVATSLLAGRGEGPSRRARLLSFSAPVLVTLGMGALFLDLANRENVWRFYLALRPTSPMSWGAWLLVAVYPVALLHSLALLDAAQAEWLGGLARRVRLGGLVAGARALALRHAVRLRQANGVLGLGLGVYTGVLLSTLGARPLWSSGLLAVLFLVSGVSTGLAFLLLFRLPHAERHLLARWDGWALRVELAVLALFLVGLLTGGGAGRAAVGLLLGGRYTAQFWALVVVAGLAVPLLLEHIGERQRRAVPALAPALVLLGGLSLRWILVAAGQA